MSSLSDQEKRYLLDLARFVIASSLRDGPAAEKPENIYPRLSKKRGAFVTLHKKGALRGCIGTIEPVKPLANCIEENARNAAFKDPRFAPVSAEELSSIDIEISVLSLPEPLSFKDENDLKRQLIPSVHGVILSKGWKRATFLPQVWKQLPDKDLFLQQLCLKAGLEHDCWRKPGVEVRVYQVEFFSETSEAAMKARPA
jgi:AmmeMemoRadiSam system protein A